MYDMIAVFPVNVENNKLSCFILYPLHSNNFTVYVNFIRIWYHFLIEFFNKAIVEYFHSIIERSASI